ncbi:MAG: hypothetical protein Q9163_006412 [Psora crenata]
MNETRRALHRLYNSLKLTAVSSADNQKSKRRGRPPPAGAPTAPSSSLLSGQTNSEPLRPSQHPPALLPQDPNVPSAQTSATKATPTKAPVIKALPTVRDHTTDQLTPGGDEYIPREHDPEGERKVAPTGQPLQGREYKMRTFYVPNRGEKLFMLATECARVLGYRDSYLLFNKNRSLYKIIATQAEKDELIHQEILPYSYRSRQIAIVTAKSMFRQFGARVIHEGRRVRDDYWEAKARKQGFTEEDMAGDKRPGATKARDAAALEQANNDPSGGLTHQDIDYRDVPLPSELSGSLPPPMSANTPIPMIQTEARDYGHIPRVRQDISGTPYQDRTQPSPVADIVHQATNAAELNKAIAQQRSYRGKSYNDSWNRKIDPPIPSTKRKVERSPTMNRSPQISSNSLINPPQQQPMLQHQQPSSQLMSPQRYPQHSHHPNSQQSPIRQAMAPSIRADLQHPPRPSVYNANPQGSQTPYSSYPQPQLWGQPPPHPQASQSQQSPISSHHSTLSQHYSPSSHPQQLQPPPPHSPHHHPSPHQPPQLHHSGSHGNVYSSMGGGGLPSTAYTGLGTSQQRNIYNQPGPHGGSPNASQQPYLQQTTATQQGGMQGWAPPPLGGGQQSGAPSWSGYPASSGGF